MRRIKTFKPGYRGQALVEFALVLPMLVILAVLIVQYGIIYQTTISLTNVAREGGRFAAIAPASDEDIAQRVQDVVPSNLNKADVETSVDPDSTRVRGKGGDITVIVTYDMRKKIFLPSTFFGVQLFAQTYTTQATFAVQ